ncbi:BTAD domain-containing putative transcriptional regulator [Gordonia desulfuricans]|uniref:BTAD domain-containing putative transcriptional regulator n=1 Tax=Gordonia desulfuricans TaxID=89051 RepID=UPI00073EDFFB|nr:BTAD domain-containing putative transcriptional regulator [Gordonia desulfuricans]
MRQYLVLGPLEVRRENDPIDLGSPKQRSVLAALLLARGAVVPVHRLIDTVWGADPPAAATTSLQAYVSNLRRALRGDTGDASPIQRVASGYRLELGDDRLDVAEFAALARSARIARDEAQWTRALADAETALGLWRGELLAGELDGIDWVVAEAAALVEGRLAVQEVHITALLADGDTGGALADIVALRARDPLRDRAVWLHMVALYRAGRATEALDVYTEHSRILDEELGLEPGVELVELQGAILRHDPVIAAWPRPPHWSGAVEVTAPHSIVVDAEPVEAPMAADPSSDSLPLVGRESQIDRVRALLASTGESARWLLISGPAGIGKTRLAEEVATIAVGVGGRVVWVRCPDAEGIPAWWPLRQLCRALEAEPEAVLSVPPGVDADTARFAVYERVQNLLETTLGSGPLTVVVDDAQWADSMTLGLLTYLSTVMRASGLSVVVTVRDGEGGSDVDRLRSALSRAAGAHLALPHLVRDEVVALVRAVAGDEMTPEDADTLTRRTGGIPLFVAEFARLPAEERRREMVPAAVRSVLDRRLTSLDPAVLEVITHAAVIGDEVDITLLAEVMERGIAEIADCLDDAIDERILVSTDRGGTTRFAHALLREEALAAIRPLRRCRMHLRVADVVGTRPGPGWAMRRALHLLEASPVADARDVVDACRIVAEDATARWDSENAAHWLGMALRTHESAGLSDHDTTDRDDLLIAMLAAQARAGLVQMVLKEVETRLHEAIRSGAPTTAGRLAGSLIRSTGAWPWIGPGIENPTLHAALDAAADHLGDQIESGDAKPGVVAGLARVLAASAIGHCYNRDGAVPAGLLARAEVLAADTADDQVVADVMLARIITYSGVADHARDCLALAQQVRQLRPRDDVDDVILDAVATMATMTLGDVSRTEQLVRRGISGSERLRLPVLRAQLRWMEAAIAVWRGRFDLAEEHFRTAVAVHEQTELYVAGSGAIAMMALAAERGRLDESLMGQDIDPLEWARSVPQEYGADQVVILLAAGVARIAAAAGDDHLARSMITIWSDDGRAMIWTSLGQAVMLAHAVADLEMPEYAQEFIDYLMPYRSYIATVGHVGNVGPVALAIAELCLLTDQFDLCDELLTQARNIAEVGEGEPALLRVRLIAARRQPSSPSRDADLVHIATRAGEIGLDQVARSARTLLDDA